MRYRNGWRGELHVRVSEVRFAVSLLITLLAAVFLLLQPRESVVKADAAAFSEVVPVQVSATPPMRAAFDYDGDGKSDLSVFRPSDTNWYRNNSSSSALAADQFGISIDRIAPADYDGDGKTDLAVFRERFDGSTRIPLSVWFIFNSSNGTYRNVIFGSPG